MDRTLVLSDVNNLTRPLPVSVGVKNKLLMKTPDPFLGGGAYTASDNALRIKSGLLTWDTSHYPDQVF